jgi:cyclopropane fatty-acyl-phospholipid synthase-like methyltransferase
MSFISADGPRSSMPSQRWASRADDHVLDVGSGLGGASRYVASTVGCRVTGIDLTSGYVAAAQELARRTGLGDRVSYHVGSALNMPDRVFDAAMPATTI